MKLLILVTLLLLTTIALYAQEDSLKFRKNQTRDLQPADYPMFNNIQMEQFNFQLNENALYPEQNKSLSFNTKYKKNKSNTSYSKFIIPATLISYGAFSHINQSLRQLDKSTHHEVSEHFQKRVHFDDYLQYAPVTAVYGLDLAGIKAKHNFRDRTFVVLTSYLIMGGIVQTGKRITNIKRPDEADKHSLPSGHTATAFVGAQILFREYKHASPWIAVSGYVAASATGAMRVVNKKHWVSDVATGAGIGILSAEAGYMLLPVFHKIIGVEQNKSNLVVAPVVGNNNYGLGLACTF